MENLKIDVEGVLKEKNPKLYKKLPKFLIRYLERIVHQKEINDFLAINGHLKNYDFCDAVVQELKLSVTFNGLEKIPSQGPVILVMNHPLGGVDGLAFIAKMRSKRQDLVFLVNDILLQMNSLNDLFVGVNKHGKNTAETWNSIDQIFTSDKAVCIFPAGLVSRKTKGFIQDSVWKKTFVTYAKKTGHDIIPIHIEGKLSRRFYGLYRWRTFFGIKASLEMLFLADEMFKQRNKKVTYSVGDPLVVPNDSAKSDHEWAQEIKQSLYSIPRQYGKNNG
jgi:1-acyl-sn-glycerol-3-phosphate acyltransferase